MSSQLLPNKLSIDYCFQNKKIEKFRNFTIPRTPTFMTIAYAVQKLLACQQTLAGTLYNDFF